MKKIFFILFLSVIALRFADAQTYGFKWIDVNTIRYYDHKEDWDGKGSLCSTTNYWDNCGNVFVEKDHKRDVTFKVRILEHHQFADVIVRAMYGNDIPYETGDWLFVNDRKKAQITIRYVKSGEDFRIYFTKNGEKGYCSQFAHDNDPEDYPDYPY